MTTLTAATDVTSVRTTRLVLGTMTFGDTVDAAGAARMLDVALDAGISGVDTAYGYAGGASEEILADLLATRRDRVLLATKVGIPHPDAGGAAPLSAEGLTASVRGSLRRLRSDHVDLLYLHQPDRATPPAETLTAVASLIAEGTVRALGVSNYAAWQIAELNTTADTVGCPRPVVAQQLYNLLARRVEDEYLEFARSSGLATVVYNPLGGGLLSGRHSFGERPAEGRFATSRLAGMYTERYWNRELFDAVARLGGIADAAGLSLVELALRWLHHRDGVSALLLGGSRPEHLVSNVQALERGPLAPDVVAACDQVGLTLRGPMPAYNR